MGDQLRQVTDLLHVAGVTVADIADRSGSSMQTVSAELAGHVPMSERTIEAISSYAGETVAEEVRAIAAPAHAVGDEAATSRV